MATWTRRQVLTQMGLAAAAVHTLDPHELCCSVAAHAQTADKDLFELKKVADGAEGVARVFEILREQMHIAMGLCGRTKIADLTPDIIFRAD